MSKGNNVSLGGALRKATHQRTIYFSILILGALIAFEIFNYSTTDFAMSDLLGDLKFGGMRWATILAIAFCGIDFAGIARLFTPETGTDEPNEVWYLFGAWLLAATMNAVLTWWGVSIAILQHQSLGNAVIARETLLKVVPIFVALMVWTSRVLIIGTFSVAGERLFWRDEQKIVNAYQTSKTRSSFRTPRPSTRPKPQRSRPSSVPRPIRNQPEYSTSFSPKPKPTIEGNYGQPALQTKSRTHSDPGKY
jgi:hypothetical protein